MKPLPKTLSLAKWKTLATRVKDISYELPDSFLMFGQWMRAKIEYKGRKYVCTGWNTGTCYVDVREVQD